MTLHTEAEANASLSSYAEERAHVLRTLGFITKQAKPCPRGDCAQGRTCDCLVQFCGDMRPTQWIQVDRGVEVHKVPASRRWASRWTRIKEAAADWWRRHVVGHDVWGEP